MAQKSKIQGKKARDDLEPAHKGYYEDWLEPDWRSSTNGSSSTGAAKDPKLKDRSKFKFADDYQRALSTTGNSLLKNRSNSTSNLKSNKDWVYRDTDFEKFYAWVINRRLSDLYLAKSLLFYDD